jgi:hypothetical protein
MSTPCTLCSADAGDEHTVLCLDCHRRYLGAAVRATGEFVVPPLPPEASPSSSFTSLPAVSEACTYCSKPATQVKKLLGNGTVTICNECIALCVDVMMAELGDGWRG